jgi:hypothetical protein
MYNQAEKAVESSGIKSKFKQFIGKENVDVNEEGSDEPQSIETPSMTEESRRSQLTGQGTRGQQGESMYPEEPGSSTKTAEQNRSRQEYYGQQKFGGGLSSEYGQQQERQQQYGTRPGEPAHYGSNPTTCEDVYCEFKTVEESSPYQQEQQQRGTQSRTQQQTSQTSSKANPPQTEKKQSWF